MREVYICVWHFCNASIIASQPLYLSCSMLHYMPPMMWSEACDYLTLAEQRLCERATNDVKWSLWLPDPGRAASLWTCHQWCEVKPVITWPWPSSVSVNAATAFEVLSQVIQSHLLWRYNYRLCGLQFSVLSWVWRENQKSQNILSVNKTKVLYGNGNCRRDAVWNYAIHISDNRPSQRWWRLC